jgi:RNA-directed DNA polymerase
MRKNILKLDNERANKYFLNHEKYFSTDLPPYFEFEKVLKKISKLLSRTYLYEKVLLRASKTHEVNHIIYGNKDGNYAWRKYQLINPLLYVSLVNLITEKNAWSYICDKFEEFYKNKSIRCVSIPVIEDTYKKQKAAQVNEWFDSVEKDSIRLALDYEYYYQTDIVDCYGSIYTHSISWALHSKKIAKEQRGYDQLLGNKIDCHLRAMSHGQTNGIPQGSILMDFIAEMVLAYADQELSIKINNLNKDSYKILRYKDDYRIFTQNSKDGEFIMKSLSEVLAQIGMSLNTSKTKKSENIIVDSIKPDKLYMLHLPELKVGTKKLLRRELLRIYDLGTKFPNCGSVNIRLMNLNDTVKHSLLQQNYIEHISILINIAINNPRSYPVVAVLISKIIDKLSGDNKKRILDQLIRKFNLLPNSGFLEIWTQRISIKHKIYFFYEEPLCRLATGENISVFNNEWIESSALAKILGEAQYVNTKTIAKLDNIIARSEVELFTLNLQY